MESQKNTRRKRKDHESRDFTCRCGKGYLSYAAAYTHVKNKHSLEKQYLDDIGKPQRQKLPRGRPKQRKQAHSSVEIQQLSVVEEAILKIYQSLHKKFDKVILEGNSKKNASQVDEEFQRLIDKGISSNLRANQKANEFISELGKHFTAQISAKIKLVILIISKAIGENFDQNMEINRQVVAQLDAYDLWTRENQINTIIYDAFLKWNRLIYQ